MNSRTFVAKVLGAAKDASAGHAPYVGDRGYVNPGRWHPREARWHAREGCRASFWPPGDVDIVSDVVRRSGFSTPLPQLLTVATALGLFKEGVPQEGGGRRGIRDTRRSSSPASSTGEEEELESAGSLSELPP